MGQFGGATRTAAGRHRRFSRAGPLLRELYESESARASRFRYGLLLFDAATIVFLVVSSFIERTIVFDVIDATFGLLLLAEFLARLSINRDHLYEVLHPLSLADIAVIISFLTPVVGGRLAFLRVLRTLRLFRSY